MAMWHVAVGGMVVGAYAFLVVLNLLNLGGMRLKFTKYVSMAAAFLLLLQYVIGFLLLGGGFRNSMAHYVVALAAILTVGAEHGTRDGAKRAMPLLASIFTLVLVLVAYYLGMKGVEGVVTPATGVATPAA